MNALNAARGKDPLTVIALIDQYRGKRVRWDCTILHTNAVDKWYAIGANEKAEPKSRAFAQFRSDEFDRFVNEGEHKTVEGVFRSADEDGIVLYDCRFVPESKQP